MKRLFPLFLLVGSSQFTTPAEGHHLLDLDAALVFTPDTRCFILGVPFPDPLAARARLREDLAPCGNDLNRRVLDTLLTQCIRHERGERNDVCSDRVTRFPENILSFSHQRIRIREALSLRSLLECGEDDIDDLRHHHHHRISPAVTAVDPKADRMVVVTLHRMVVDVLLPRAMGCTTITNICLGTNMTTRTLRKVTVVMMAAMAATEGTVAVMDCTTMNIGLGTNMATGRKGTAVRMTRMAATEASAPTDMDHTITNIGLGTKMTARIQMTVQLKGRAETVRMAGTAAAVAMAEIVVTKSTAPIAMNHTTHGQNM
ncbi:hypothetical protein LshimejAT787_0406600 [Lyophyllum shimeji]|uniref:Uncharacterized protein n=1 Tax=Lyophyllum shimeji TaxID=47721 RepID=A0A9P3PLF5_LYOSH|nr:hypothetical protein LshimejAT787_0406600 [Lyophyllum shimeji]